MHFWALYNFMLKLMVACTMYSFALLKRDKFILKYLMGIVICAFSAILFSYVELIVGGTSAMLFVFAFIVVLGCVELCYEGTLWNLLFIGTAGYLTQYLSGQIEGFVGVLSNDINTFHGWFSQVLVDIVVYVVLYFIFARRLRKELNPEMNNKKLIVLVMMTLVLCTELSRIVASLSSTVEAYSEEVAHNVQLIGNVYSGFSCIVLLLLLFGYLSEWRLETRLVSTLHLLQESKAQYELSKENIELINMKCHDLKHQIASLRKEYNEEAISEIEQAVNIYDSTIKTGCDVLDVILTEKSLICQKHQIRFSCIADGALLQNVDTSDLYSLFGNLIDNAMEAVSKFSTADKKEISLSIKKSGEFLVIWIENFYDSNLEFREGIPVTTKKNKKYHGYGLRSIQFIVKKYSGTVQINSEQNTFRVKIVFPLGMIEKK